MWCKVSCCSALSFFLSKIFGKSCKKRVNVENSQSHFGTRANTFVPGSTLYIEVA